MRLFLDEATPFQHAVEVVPVDAAPLPMIYLSNMLIPLPKSIHAIAFASPAFYLDQLALGAAGTPIQGAPALYAAVLAGVTLLFTVLSVRRLAQMG
jgi:hypothetical protein